MYDSIVIVGATATGKTKVAIDLAKRLNTEIINADSMYIYKELNVGTAKPTMDEMQGVRHHLIDLIDCDQDYNVVNYRDDASKVIGDFASRNLLPIIVGGTGFYINSLIMNYSYGFDTHDEQLRQKLINELNCYGKEFLYNKLKELDLQTANTLHVNDTSRIIRAIEILTLTGKSKMSMENCSNSILNNPLIIGLTMPRDVLYDRINCRVDSMINNGLVDEVKSLYDKGLTPENSQSMKGIGYKEIVEYLRGNFSFEFAIEKIKQHTRNYAKRQITWFKRYDNIHWFDSYSDDNIVDKIIELYNKEISYL